MEFSCECQDENCKVKINMTLDEFLHVADSRCSMVSEDCLTGPDPEDNLFEKKDGYSLYKGTLE
jgi:hypothetical protein